MDNGNNLPQKPPIPPQIDINDEAELKKAQNFVIAASIMAPVSMIIGGALLSTAALVCAILSMTKVRKLLWAAEPVRSLASRLNKACIVAIAVSSIALLLNVISAVIMYPIVYEAMVSGDFSNLMSPQGGGNSSGNSTWG